MQLVFRILVLGALALQLSGCATVFGHRDHSVQVASNPQGAEVLLNGMSMGSTPTRVGVSTWSPGTITLQKPGYKTQNVVPQTQFQMVGLLDIFLWPTFFVDIIAGNTMAIAPEYRFINVNMAPEDGKTK